MVRAAGPERRTMPMPPRPGGVEMATMVSSNSGTIFYGNGIFFLRLVKWGVFTGGFAISTAQNDGFFVVLSVIFVVRTWFLVRGFRLLRICHFFELYFLLRMASWTNGSLYLLTVAEGCGKNGSRFRANAHLAAKDAAKMGHPVWVALRSGPSVLLDLLVTGTTRWS